MKQTVVLYPSIGVGHLTPMVQLAKLFLRRGFDVAVAVISPPFYQKEIAEAVDRLSAANPLVTFYSLPAVDPGEEADQLKRYLETVRLSTAHLADYLRSVSAAALVYDMFCCFAAGYAAELGIPSCMYFTSGAGALAVFINNPYSDPDEDIRIPGMPVVRSADKPVNMKKPEIVSMFVQFGHAERILVNSFEWLEANAVKALRNGVCIPCRATPPVYCIGPLVAVGDGGQDQGSERHECLTWLDAQPESSVVFLCFGSMGAFTASQIKEIAVGLEKSGQRFLWVVRGALPDGEQRRQQYSAPPPELDVLLPEGFLERTKHVGMVVKSWAPQTGVLQHKATGAFVTHCGWNSTLEAVAAGLPMVCWPLYAEQQLNKVLIVEDMRLGVEMAGYDADIVAAEEIATKVKWVMESEEAKELRRRAAEAKEQAAAALKDGGSSMLAFDECTKDAGLLHG